MTSTTYTIHWATQRRGERELREGPRPVEPERVVPRIPARVARLVALGQRIDRLVRSGEFADYAAVATVGGLTRARVSQFVDLTLLAPDIQEELLLMEWVPKGREPIGEQHLRAIVRELDWGRQRHMFNKLRAQFAAKSHD